MEKIKNMNHKNPLVTIIIPVYNVEKYIERCIKSVASQSYTNIEIIVIDDESTDKSLCICEKIAEQDTRIIVISKKNEGAGYARNMGMDKAKGKYVMFIDSDDYLLPGCIERVVNVAEKEKCDMVKFDYAQGFDDNFNFSLQKKNKIKKYNTYEAFRTRSINISVCGKLYRREKIKDIRYPKVSTHDDEFITYKFIYACKSIIVLDEIYYYYYMSSESIMRKKRENMPLDYMKAFDERKEFFENKNEQELLEITCREYAIRLMLSYIYYNDYKHSKLDRREILNRFRKEYKIGKKTAVGIKEKFSLMGFNLFPKGFSFIIKAIRR